MTSGSHEGYQAQGQTQPEQLILGWVTPVKSLGFGPTQTWVHIIFLPLTHSVALDQLCKLAEPQFPYREMGTMMPVWGCEGLACRDRVLSPGPGTL